MPPDATARAKSDSRLSSRQATIGSMVEEALAAVVAIETESTQLPKMFDSFAVSGIKPDSTTRATDFPSSSLRQANMLLPPDWASSNDAAKRHLLSAASCSGVDSTRFESAASAPSAPILSSKQTATDSPSDTLVAGSVVCVGRWCCGWRRCIRGYYRCCGCGRGFRVRWRATAGRGQDCDSNQ